MATIELTLTQLLAVVGVAVGLAATDAAAISRIAIAYVAKKLGVSPGQIHQYDSATDGEATGDDGDD